ncbi:MAG: hypothetical protein GF408_01870, partial [Candidatus Omnitrophica bacterium]|nr:hypothetical protein [Candidatus Omnitrophota bacterium]
MRSLPLLSGRCSRNDIRRCAAASLGPFRGTPLMEELMKALGILAGPRKGGATDSAVDSILKGIRDKGGETEKVSLYDLDIEPCTGCCACHRRGVCVIEDDHPPLIGKMAEADVVVMGSPVYWSNITSEAKKFLDRGLPFFEWGKMGPVRKARKPAKVILVVSCGAPFPFSHILGVVPGAVGAMKKFFGCTKAGIRTFC